MRAGDEQPAEEQQRRELGPEDGQARQRLRHQDAKVGPIRKERVAHQAHGAGDDPHRNRDEERVVGDDRALVGVRRSRRERGVLRHEHASQEQAERNRHGEGPQQRTLQRLRAVVGQESEVEERGEEVAGQHDFGSIAHGQAPAIVSRICRASGAKSGCSVARTNVSSSESGPSRSKSATRRSSTIRPDDSTMTREQSFSTMSNRWVLKKIIRPSFASMRRSVRSSSPALTSRPENGSSSTRSWGLWRSADATRTRWRMPFENAVIGLVAAVVQLEQPKQLGDARLERLRRQTPEPADEHEVIRRREVRVEGGLLGHVSDAALVGNRIVGAADSRERDGTGGRLEQPDDQIDRRALAGSIGPQVADDLTGMEIEAHPIEREQAAIPLRQPARLEHGRYRRPRRLGRLTQMRERRSSSRSA